MKFINQSINRLNSHITPYKISTVMLNNVKKYKRKRVQ